MMPIIEDSVLNTDLNCQFYDLLNVGALEPVPPGVVGSDDPRLIDAREPIPGTVNNASVADDAAILQSKLNLNGQIPVGWLGTTATTAAQGDLAEYLANKNQANGYCGLDGTAKVPPARLPGTTGTGTVTSVGLTMPSEFVVTGTPITSAGTFSCVWAAVPDGSWFGNKEGASGPPQFYSDPFPAALIPDLDASIVTSGIFDPARLPVAVGLGTGHAPGAVPDPGSGIAGDGPMLGTELGTDYLARDMTYKPKPGSGATYQPVCPSPDLTISTGPPYIVTILSSLPGGSLFFSIDNSGGGFSPVPTGNQVTINSGQSLYAYCARTGYTNSAIVVMPAPYAPPEELVVTGELIDPTEAVEGDDSLDVTVGP